MRFENHGCYSSRLEHSTRKNGQYAIFLGMLIKNPAIWPGSVGYNGCQRLAALAAVEILRLLGRVRHLRLEGIWAR
jgi:hypothetical protein